MDDCRREPVFPRRLVILTLTLLILACRQTIEVPEMLTGTGVVEKVIAHDGRVVIAHDDIPDFMRAMTMSFEVKDPALLAHVAPGQRVRFTLEKKKETLYLVEIKQEAADAASQ